VADVIGKWCAHKIGSDDGGSDGGTRSLVLTMDNDGAEVTHHNRYVGPKLDLLREKSRAHVQVQSPVQVQTMDLTPSRSNALQRRSTKSAFCNALSHLRKIVAYGEGSLRAKA